MCGFQFWFPFATNQNRVASKARRTCVPRLGLGSNWITSNRMMKQRWGRLQRNWAAGRAGLLRLCQSFQGVGYFQWGDIFQMGNMGNTYYSYRIEFTRRQNRGGICLNTVDEPNPSPPKKPMETITFVGVFPVFTGSSKIIPGFLKVRNGFRKHPHCLTSVGFPMARRELSISSRASRASVEQLEDTASAASGALGARSSDATITAVF